MASKRYPRLLTEALAGIGGLRQRCGNDSLRGHVRDPRLSAVTVLILRPLHTPEGSQHISATSLKFTHCWVTFFKSLFSNFEREVLKSSTWMSILLAEKQRRCPRFGNPSVWEARD